MAKYGIAIRQRGVVLEPGWPRRAAGCHHTSGCLAWHARRTEWRSAPRDAHTSRGGPRCGIIGLVLRLSAQVESVVLKAVGPSVIPALRSGQCHCATVRSSSCRPVRCAVTMPVAIDTPHAPVRAVHDTASSRTPPHGGQGSGLREPAAPREDCRLPVPRYVSRGRRPRPGVHIILNKAVALAT